MVAPRGGVEPRRPPGGAVGQAVLATKKKENNSGGSPSFAKPAPQACPRANLRLSVGRWARFRNLGAPGNGAVLPFVHDSPPPGPSVAVAAASSVHCGSREICPPLVRHALRSPRPVSPCRGRALRPSESPGPPPRPLPGSRSAGAPARRGAAGEGCSASRGDSPGPGEPVVHRPAAP